MVSRFRQLLLGTAALLLLPSLAQAQCAAYVSDQISNDLLRVDLASGSTTLVASGLNIPRGVTLNPTGTIAYVAETNGQVVAVDVSPGRRLHRNHHDRGGRAGHTLWARGRHHR